MEPECAIAFPERDRVFICIQLPSLFMMNSMRVPIFWVWIQNWLSARQSWSAVDLAEREDMSVQHHAALMAWVTGKPVKVKFSREESVSTM